MKVSYYKVGLIFVVVTIISIGRVKMVLTKVSSEIWEHGDIPTTKSDRARNMSSQLIRQVLSKPLG